MFEKKVTDAEKKRLEKEAKKAEKLKKKEMAAQSGSGKEKVFFRTYFNVTFHLLF